jgi:LacI family transcriptional regulator
MLALDRRPTAFLTASLITALGVRRAVEERGLVLGRDVSIVTHDDELSYFSAPDTVPVFTATRSSVREAGRLAAEMLLDLVEAPGGPPRHRLLEAVLTVGQSTGPAPDRD